MCSEVDVCFPICMASMGTRVKEKKSRGCRNKMLFCVSVGLNDNIPGKVLAVFVDSLVPPPH